MDNRHRAGELGKEGCLFHCGVTAADDGDIVVAEEETITGGTGADTMTKQRLLTRSTDITRSGTGCQDDSVSLVLFFTDPDRLDIASEIHAVDNLHAQVSAEALCLCAHLIHQLRPHDALGETWVVLHIGSRHKQAAKLDALEHHRLQVGTGCVGGSRVTGGTGTDDDQVVNDIAHEDSYNFYLSHHMAHSDAQ